MDARSVARAGFDGLARGRVIVIPGAMNRVGAMAVRFTPRAWVRRTPASFQFAVKLFQKFTHPDMYLSRNGVSDWDLSREDADLFRQGIDPIASAGRLAAVLVQFPPSFHAEAETRDYLDWVLEAFAGYALAVELRHRSWSDEADDTAARLKTHAAAWVLIDEPKFSSSIRQAGLDDDTSRLTYIRLHGRNADAWFDEGAGRDRRYDYLYTVDELQPLATSARGMATRAQAVYAVANNHFRGQAVVAALQLKHLIQGIEPEAPPALAAAYPGLRGPQRLF